MGEDPSRKITYANFNIVRADNQVIARRWSEERREVRDMFYYRTLIWEEYDDYYRDQREKRYDGFGIPFGRPLAERLK